MKNMMTRKTPGLKARGRAARLAVFAFAVFVAGSSLGPVPTGLARVFVNGADCGVAWCAPWEVDVTAAVRPGRNALRVEYANNWHNRLVGDCSLPPERRVTRSAVRYWNVPRRGRDDNPWTLRPALYSGPSAYDPLQPSGLLGPVRLMAFDRQ